MGFFCVSLHLEWTYALCQRRTHCVKNVRILSKRTHSVKNVRGVGGKDPTYVIKPNVGDIRKKDVRRVKLEDKRKFRFVCV